jgi:hypothetical protein
MADVEARGAADGKDGAEALLRDPLEDDADVTDVDEEEVKQKLMAERQKLPLPAEAETPSSSAAAFTGYR